MPTWEYLLLMAVFAVTSLLLGYDFAATRGRVQRGFSSRMGVSAAVVFACAVAVNVVDPITTSTQGLIFIVVFVFSLAIGSIFGNRAANEKVGGQATERSRDEVIDEPLG